MVRYELSKFANGKKTNYFVSDLDKKKCYARMQVIQVSSWEVRQDAAHASDQSDPNLPGCLLLCSDFHPPALSKHPSNKRLTYIRKLFVDRSKERCNIGSALLQTAVLQSRDDGNDGMVAVTAAENSCPFYEKNGFLRNCFCDKNNPPSRVGMHLPAEQADLAGKGRFKELTLGERRVQNETEIFTDEALGLKFETPA